MKNANRDTARINPKIKIAAKWLIFVILAVFAYTSSTAGKAGSKALLLFPLALALAVFESILSDVSPDSFAGRVASVMIGSTETTFYTVAVYYGITKVKNTRHVIASSLTADITGFVLSALTVRLLLY